MLIWMSLFDALAPQLTQLKQIVQVRKGAERQTLITYPHLPSVAPAGPISFAEMSPSQIKLKIIFC
jgi:hypothetical protein